MGESFLLLFFKKEALRMALFSDAGARQGGREAATVGVQEGFAPWIM
jgi:hypothetical protein